MTSGPSLAPSSAARGLESLEPSLAVFGGRDVARWFWLRSWALSGLVFCFFGLCEGCCFFGHRGVRFTVSSFGRVLLAHFGVGQAN